MNPPKIVRREIHSNNIQNISELCAQSAHRLMTCCDICKLYECHRILFTSHYRKYAYLAVKSLNMNE